MPFYDVMVTVRETHYVRVSAGTPSAAQQAAEQQVIRASESSLVEVTRTPEVQGALVARCCGQEFTRPMDVVLHQDSEHVGGLLTNPERD